MKFAIICFWLFLLSLNSSASTGDICSVFYELLTKRGTSPSSILFAGHYRRSFLHQSHFLQHIGSVDALLRLFYSFDDARARNYVQARESNLWVQLQQMYLYGVAATNPGRDTLLSMPPPLYHFFLRRMRQTHAVGDYALRASGGRPPYDYHFITQQLRAHALHRLIVAIRGVTDSTSCALFIRWLSVRVCQLRQSDPDGSFSSAFISLLASNCITINEVQLPVHNDSSLEELLNRAFLGGRGEGGYEFDALQHAFLDLTALFQRLPFVPTPPYADCYVQIIQDTLLLELDAAFSTTSALSTDQLMFQSVARNIQVHVERVQRIFESLSNHLQPYLHVSAAPVPNLTLHPSKGEVSFWQMPRTVYQPVHPPLDISSAQRAVRFVTEWHHGVNLLSRLHHEKKCLQHLDTSGLTDKFMTGIVCLPALPWVLYDTSLQICRFYGIHQYLSPIISATIHAGYGPNISPEILARFLMVPQEILPFPISSHLVLNDLVANLTHTVP